MRQWDCRVWDSYNATEAMPLTIPCVLGRFHVNADWMILEPVDADLRPVPFGTPSTTTLVTNLANHLQPIIRYEMGDSVTFSAQRCRCGSPLPVVTVVGRMNDLLRFTGQAWISHPWRWGASSRKPSACTASRLSKPVRPH